MSQPISITWYSTALFSTWYFVEPLGLLFDCGDGVCAGLLQKARKVKHVFISHADRDHLTGLTQFQQLNGRPGLHIHYPADAGSFPALAEFLARFDPHVTGTNWHPLSVEEEVQIRSDLVVRAIENSHVQTNRGQLKSVSFAVESVSRRLKTEFQGLPGRRIAELRKQLGSDAMTDDARTVELIYSGDTPVETDGRYQNANVLIHEATFLTAAEIEPDNPHRNKHSSLDTVMEMVADSNIGTLVLGHFSSRYSREQIDQAVRRETERCGVRVPVHCVYPGETPRISDLGRGVS